VDGTGEHNVKQKTRTACFLSCVEYRRKQEDSKVEGRLLEKRKGIREGNKERVMGDKHDESICMYEKVTM
jgi:hypothetical protein